MRRAHRFERPALADFLPPDRRSLESHSNPPAAFLFSCSRPRHHRHQCGRIARFVVLVPNSGLPVCVVGLSLPPSGVAASTSPSLSLPAVRLPGNAVSPFSSILSSLRFPVAARHIRSRCPTWTRTHLRIGVPLAVGRWSILLTCAGSRIGSVFRSFWHTMTSDDRR